MATFHFDLVSPEKLAFSGEVDQVDVPGVEGDFGVLAGHAPVVAAIRPGILTVTTGGTAAEDHRARRPRRGFRQGPDGARRCRHLARGTRRPSSPTRSPTWKPSSPKRRARRSTGDRAARSFQEHPAPSSVRRRCISVLPRAQRAAARCLRPAGSPPRRISQKLAPPSIDLAPERHHESATRSSRSQRHWSNSAGWPLRGVSGSISSSGR